LLVASSGVTDFVVERKTLAESLRTDANYALHACFAAQYHSVLLAARSRDRTERRAVSLQEHVSTSVLLYLMLHPGRRSLSHF